MADRAQVFEQASIGTEVLGSSGVAVAATRTLASLKVTATPDPDVKTFIPSGLKFASAAVLLKETTGIKLDGIGTYNELLYPAAGILTNPVITTPAGAVKARKQVFSMSSSAPDSPRSYSLELGNSAVRSWHVPWVQMVDFGLTISRKDGVKATGSALGQAIIDDRVRWLNITGAPAGGNLTITVGGQTTANIAYNATATAIQTAIAALSNVGAGNVVVIGGPLPGSPVRIRFTGIYEYTPVPVVIVNGAGLTGGTAPAATIGRNSPAATQLDIIPISPTQIDVWAAPTYAGLAGATKFDRNFKIDWKLGGRYAPIMPLNTSNGSGFGGMVEQQPKGTFSMDVGADDVGMGFLANLRRGETVFVRTGATGPNIEIVSTVAFPYLFQLDVACKLTKISELKDIDGQLMGVTYSGEWAHDPTWGKATELMLQNDIAAL